MGNRPMPVTVGGRRPRSRGNRGEAEVCNLLRERGWERARRNLGSGGYGGNDIVEGPDGYAWEVKRVERLNVYAAFDQARVGARPTETAIVAHRRDRTPWLATLPLDDLLELIEYRERAEGRL